MSYVKRILLKGETIIAQTHPHKIIFLSALTWLVIAFVALYMMFTSSQYLFISIYKIISFIFFVLAAYDFLLSFIRLKTSEFAVTNKRVLIKVGWLRRQTVETFLRKVESLEIDQSLIGRILGYGTIIIAGTGGTKEYYHRVNKPIAFQKAVQQQIYLVFNKPEDDDTED